MGYRDDFFIASNIVGYTGDLQDNPTVYFETDEEQAHITQAHKKADNVGRGAVFHDGRLFESKCVFRRRSRRTPGRDV